MHNSRPGCSFVCLPIQPGPKVSLGHHLGLPRDNFRMYLDFSSSEHSQGGRAMVEIFGASIKNYVLRHHYAGNGYLVGNEAMVGRRRY